MVCLATWGLRFLCFLGTTAALHRSESHSASHSVNKLKTGRKNGIARDIVTVDGKKVQKNRGSPRRSEKAEDSPKILKTRAKGSVRRTTYEEPKRLKRKRRCFLGSPYDCPPGFEDSILDWKTPWGWGPGPWYPEYGPHFHQSVCAQRWRGPGGLVGYGHNWWGRNAWGGHALPGHAPAQWKPWDECCCCCGNEGGEQANDAPHLNDAPSTTPPKPPLAPKPDQPRILHPLLGTPPHIEIGGVPGKTVENKKVERGNRRFDVASTSVPGSVVEPSVFTDPGQASIGSWKNPDQTTPDKITGSLFLWKWNGRQFLG